MVGLATRNENILKDAISNLKSSLQVLQRDDDPVLWRKIQHNLGRAYAFLGEMLDDVKLLRSALWPAPGFEDTELGVLLEPEVAHGEAEVYAGVQA